MAGGGVGWLRSSMVTRPDLHPMNSSIACPYAVDKTYCGNINLTLCTWQGIGISFSPAAQAAAWIWGVPKERKVAGTSCSCLSQNLLGAEWGAGVCEQSMFTYEAFITMPRYGWYSPGGQSDKMVVLSLHSNDPNTLPYSSPPEHLGQRAQEPFLTLPLPSAVSATSDYPENLI